MEAPRIQYATTTDGVSIAYCTAGEGIPLIIAAHPEFSHLAATWGFEELARLAGLGIEVIRFDWHGTGSSDRSSLDFSPEALARDIEAVAERTLPDEPFALFSDAAAIFGSMAYAAKYPQRVRQLFFSAPIGDGRLAYEALPSHAGLDSLRRFGDAHWDAYVRARVALWAPPEESEADEYWVKVMSEAMTPDAARAWNAAIPSLSTASLLPQVEVPALVLIYPSGAPPIALQRAVAAGIPGASAVTMAGKPDLRLSEEVIAVVTETLGIGGRAGTKARAAPASRQATVRAVLFSDIEGNTNILQRLGDEGWRGVLRDHDRITRAALRAHHGSEIKHTGDGFLASFGSAADAVACAIQVQRDLAARNETADEPVAVRVGVNAGEPISEGDDIFGTAVTIAARIMSEARGGEILVSDVVKALAAGKGFSFADRGEIKMKGFDEAVRVSAVRWREDSAGPASL